jgi:hypothetical protein
MIRMNRANYPHVVAEHDLDIMSERAGSCRETLRGERFTTAVVKASKPPASSTRTRLGPASRRGHST